MSRVVVFGEALVDLMSDADGEESRPEPGGSPANVAVGLGRLGVPVTLVCGLGDDPHGRLITDRVTGSGAELAPQPCRFTGTARVTLDGAGVPSYDFAFSWTPAPMSPPPDMIALHTGSIAAALPGAEHVDAAMRAARGTATVSYDPNIRPVLLDDREAERIRVERQVSLSDVVKASEEDLGWLYPGGDPLEIAGQWRSEGPVLVVVTHGQRGATAIGPAGTVHVPAPEVAIADTVGAGDSFMSALLAGLHAADLLGPSAPLPTLSNATVSALLTQSVRAAALTCTRPGADPPTTEELNQPPEPDH